VSVSPAVDVNVGDHVRSLDVEDAAQAVGVD
jgi:hypothetical protein